MMAARIKPARVLTLLRRELPGPLDVINLITPSRFERYRWYGLLVFPAMTVVGARLLWMGRFEEAIAGEQQAGKLLIVRYPSHRRFLAMTLNPYYLAINELREAGVSRFEASFTHASVSAADLHRRRLLVAVHFRSPAGRNALAEVARIMEPAGELVYATRAVAELGILDPPEPTDPNPLTFGELALFAPEGRELSDGLAELAPALAKATDGFSLQAYRRDPLSSYRPAVLPGRAPAAAAA